jgi:DNA-binding response OmpR family regulator
MLRRWAMGKKVLVIDDEPALVDLVKTWLGSKGYEVIPAYNGTDGLRKAVSKEPAVIILDLMMPGMDGFEVLTRLKREPKTRYIPVIVLTAKRDTEHLFRAKELGSTDYMMKPFSLRDLLKLVKRYGLYKEQP